MRKMVCALVGLGMVLAGALSASGASAVTAGAGLSVYAVAGPTVFSSAYNANDPNSGGPPTNSYDVTVTNTGSEPTDGSPITIGDELPRGLTVTRIMGELFSTVVRQPPVPARYLSCEKATVTCVYSASLLPGEHLAVVVEVAVAPGTVGPVTDSVLVSGGGAPSASENVVTAIGSEAESVGEPFGLAAFSAEVTGMSGLTDEQAGDHPYEATTSFSLNSRIGGNPNYPWAYGTAGGLAGLTGHTKDVVVDLPPGFTGDPNVVEKCPQNLAINEQCPPSTQIGIAVINIEFRATRETFANGSKTFPVYNVVPSKGYPAEFIIDLSGIGINVPLYASITPESNYGVRIITPGIPGAGPPLDVSVTFFGTPENDPNVFNAYRKAVTGVTPNAFLDDPVDCSTAAQSATLSVDSWEHPGPWLADGQPDLSGPGWVSRSATLFPSLAGCEVLQFNPSLTVTPDTTQADEPAGTTVDVNVPQAPQQFPSLITPEFRDTTVTLPSGLSISPSSGDGLEGCSSAQIDLSSATLGSCPQGSQIGTVKVTTPLLPEPLEGQVFLGDPGCDPCTDADASDGNMYRLYLQFEGAGVVVKVEGRIHANASTGQLTTVFENTPQLPVSQVQLHFNGGLRASLATPQACGTFTSTADIKPWSAPITPDATPVSQFNVDWNGNGEACPGVWPFHPQLEAGTSNPNAGQLSPLTVTFNREDREQDLQQIKVVTPPGLLGSLSGVPLCGEPQADLGTCSASSQIGEMTVAAGPGSHPFYQKGEVYLTGPYRGAPFGLSIVVPTHAGPFDLGNVVVRARIDVNPETAALTVTTDPLPQILDGIPLRLRKANVTINRPGFIFNPTNCAQLHITATVSGSQGAQSEESAPFAVAGCAGLPFAPKFSVAVSGKSSRVDGTSLDAKLTLPPGAQSNIAHVKVELPRDLPSRLETLRKACTAAQFEANPAGCPTASVVGAAQAVTPILPVPLRGPVYFVSHGGEAWPDLIAVLQGYGVRVNLVGNTLISKAGITSTTFTNVPDVPVDSFELFLPSGPFSALTGLGNLCKEKLAMPTSFIAQDGAQLKQNTPIKVTGCPKAKKAAKKKAKKASRARKSSNGHGRKS
ncbi:MAG TPA: hypothetical protein VNV42_08820 [Solirubrobacteraceae bacterium]|jgi:hypothetical protein|nr:hypothetical protein [Solirubrobacteraceae bacterium]